MHKICIVITSTMDNTSSKYFASLVCAASSGSCDIICYYRKDCDNLRVEITFNNSKTLQLL